MNSILSGTLNSLDQFNAGQKQQLYESSHLNLAAVSREQSADITFVTKEGDKVTLSADSSFEAAYATYDSQARVNGAYTESRGRLSSVNFEREITISVEGDLNDEEKKEIKKVLREIFKMMKNFLSGQSGNPTVSAVKDINLETLANVEAKFEVKKSVLEASHVSAESITHSSIPASDSGRDAKPMDRLIGRMAEAVRDSKIERDRFLNFFDRKPSRISDEYLQQEPDHKKMRKMVRRLMTGLFHQLANNAG